jgi:hypothetical protein
MCPVVCPLYLFLYIFVGIYHICGLLRIGITDNDYRRLHEGAQEERLDIDDYI